MELAEFLWKRKKTAKELASAADCSPNSIGKIKRRTSTPGLLMALKLLEISSWAIELEDLLSERDKKDYENWYCTKKDCDL